MALNSLRDLFITELRDIYGAAHRIVTLLPRCIEAATFSDLQEEFKDHLDETREQIRRLDKIFNALGESPLGGKIDAMEGFVREAEAIINEPAESWVRDALLISMTQRIEHHEIAVYRTIINYADYLLENDIIEVLQLTMSEEENADRRLAKLTNDVLVGSAPDGSN